jgi:polyribonucleotide nucleotidyltransferase
LDCKPQGIPLDILCEALDEASVARNQVIDEMYAAIARPREADEMSAFTPRYATLEMDQKFVGKLIGPQGSTIKNIEATTSAKISIRQAEPAKVRSIHWFPYDPVRVVNADP